MKRKIVRQAGQAFTITLPIEWVRENKLKAGDEIDLDVVEKNIVIKTNNKPVCGKTILNLYDSDRRTVLRYLNAAYAKGFDEVELETDIDLFKELQQNMGYAIIKQKNNKYLIKDISGVFSENLDELFKRVFQMLILFYERSIKDMFEEKSATLDTLMQIEREINKFTLFLERVIIKRAYDNQSLGKIMFSFSFQLEIIGDEIFRLWKFDIENKIAKNKKIQEIVSISKKAVEKTFELNYQFNLKKFEELVELKHSIRKKSLELKEDAKTMRFVSYAVDIVEACSDLANLILMLKIDAV